LHLSSFVGEKSFRTQKKLLSFLPNNVKISFDPGSLYAQKGFSAIEPIIQNSFVMMPNELELQLITGEREIPKGAAALLAAGVKIVAVKLGAKGCYVTNGAEKQTIQPYKVQAIDTTGAGDAFNAGFLYGLLHNKTLAECGKIGNYVAAQSITKMGARAGLPYEKDLALV
jgi:ribokinase